MSELELHRAPREPSQLRWYAARLGAMSAREVAWRLNAGVGGPMRERRSRPASQPPSWGGASWAASLVELGARLGQELERDAERIASGWLDLWGTPVLTDPMQPRWRTHPFADRPWPQGAWRGWELDPKPVWELHRHQQLVPLALASALAGRPDWARTATSYLGDWCLRNPRGDGPGWNSSYEVAHRLVSWAFAVPLLRGHLDHSERARIDASFTEQARFVAARPSRFSSANNHRIAELVGLLAAGLVLDDDAGWSKAWAELETEAERQTYVDGGSREQASGYFLYVLELLTVAALLAAGRNEPLGAVDERIRAMLGWLDRVARDDGEPPGLGDDAEDRMLRLNYFEARKAGTVARRAREALAGQADGQTVSKVGAAAPVSCVLPESGLAVFRGSSGTEGVRLVVDVGELGYGRLAAHGHADALSVLLDCGDTPLLRDSGTGSYVVGEGREDFRCTASHNTVVVNGESQARALGPHLWGRRYGVDLEATLLDTHLDYVRASHDGYRSRGARAVHTRSVTFVRPGLIVVLDRIRSRRGCEARLVWNLMPGDSPDSLGAGRGALAVVGPQGTVPAEGRGRFSLRYSSQLLAPSWTWAAQGDDVVFATAIALRPVDGGSAAAPVLELAHGPAATVVRVVAPVALSLVERWQGAAAEVASVPARTGGN